LCGNRATSFTQINCLKKKKKKKKKKKENTKKKKSKKKKTPFSSAGGGGGEGEAFCSEHTGVVTLSHLVKAFSRREKKKGKGEAP